jgi:hypothetical protein
MTLYYFARNSDLVAAETHFQTVDKLEWAHRYYVPFPKLNIKVNPRILRSTRRRQWISVLVTSDFLDVGENTSSISVSGLLHPGGGNFFSFTHEFTASIFQRLANM